MSAAERFSTLALWYHVKNVVRKQVEDRNQRERKKRRFNGSLESRTVRGRERESEREKKHRNLYSKNSNSIHFNLHVCVFNAHFYTSPLKDWQKYYRTSMLLKSAYTNSKIYSSRNIFLCVIGSPNRLGTRPNRSVLTDSVLGFFSRLGRCWACISTIIKIHMKNLSY